MSKHREVPPHRRAKIGEHDDDSARRDGPDRVEVHSESAPNSVLRDAIRRAHEESGQAVPEPLPDDAEVKKKREDLTDKKKNGKSDRPASQKPPAAVDPHALDSRVRGTLDQLTKAMEHSGVGYQEIPALGDEILDTYRQINDEFEKVKVAASPAERASLLQNIAEKEAYMHRELRSRLEREIRQAQEKKGEAMAADLATAQLAKAFKAPSTAKGQRGNHQGILKGKSSSISMPHESIPSGGKTEIPRIDTSESAIEVMQRAQLDDSPQKGGSGDVKKEQDTGTKKAKRSGTKRSKSAGTADLAQLVDQVPPAPKNQLENDYNYMGKGFNPEAPFTKEELFGPEKKPSAGELYLPGEAKKKLADMLAKYGKTVDAVKGAPAAAGAPATGVPTPGAAPAPAAGPSALESRHAKRVDVSKEREALRDSEKELIKEESDFYRKNSMVGRLFKRAFGRTGKLNRLEGEMNTKASAYEDALEKRLAQGIEDALARRNPNSKLTPEQYAQRFAEKYRSLHGFKDVIAGKEIYKKDEKTGKDTDKVIGYDGGERGRAKARAEAIEAKGVTSFEAAFKWLGRRNLAIQTTLERWCSKPLLALGVEKNRAANISKTTARVIRVLGMAGVGTGAALGLGAASAALFGTAAVAAPTAGVLAFKGARALTSAFGGTAAAGAAGRKYHEMFGQHRAAELADARKHASESPEEIAAKRRAHQKGSKESVEYKRSLIESATALGLSGVTAYELWQHPHLLSFLGGAPSATDAEALKLAAATHQASEYVGPVPQDSMGYLLPESHGVEVSSSGIASTGEYVGPIPQDSMGYLPPETHGVTVSSSGIASTGEYVGPAPTNESAGLSFAPSHQGEMVPGVLEAGPVPTNESAGLNFLHSQVQYHGGEPVPGVLPEQPGGPMPTNESAGLNFLHSQVQYHGGEPVPGIVPGQEHFPDIGMKPAVYADIPVEKGHGYESLLKNMYKNLQGQHLKPEDFPKGTDVRTLLEANDNTINKIVHDMASSDKHHFFHAADGRSVVVEKGTHMWVGNDGNVHLTDTHHPDYIRAIEGSKTTPPYHPEAHAPAQSAPGQQLTDEQGFIMNAQQVPTPEHAAATPQATWTPSESEQISSPVVQPQTPTQPGITVNVDNVPSLVPRPTDALGSAPSVEAPVPLGNHAVLEHLSVFTNHLNLQIDPTHGHVFGAGKGPFAYAYGNQFADRVLAAQDYVQNNHGATVLVQAEKPVFYDGAWRPWVMEVKYSNGVQILNPDGPISPQQIGAIDPERFDSQLS